jgi:hypothetical protein
MTSIDWLVFCFAALILWGLYLSRPLTKDKQPIDNDQALKNRDDLISFYVHLIGIPIGLAIIFGFYWGMFRVIEGGMVVTKMVATEVVEQAEKLPVKIEVKIERKKL